MKTLTPAAFAARWWRNQLDVAHDNSDLLDIDGEAAELTELASAVLRQTFTTEQLDIFEAALEGLIIDEIEEQESLDLLLPVNAVVSVDYHPNDMLQEAVRAAGMERADFSFPSKTVTLVNRGCVSLRKGMRDDFNEIYRVAAGN